MMLRSPESLMEAGCLVARLNHSSPELLTYQSTAVKLTLFPARQGGSGWG